MRNKDKLDFINQILEEAEKQCDIHVVSGSISITKDRADRYKQLYSSSEWFDGTEYFDIQDDGEK